jgi:hypothetical protein
MFSSRLVQNTILSLAGAIVVLGVLWGVVAGRRAGQGQAVLAQAETLTAGLDYFYSDNNRYPSATEFQDRNLMLHYFSAYPLPVIKSRGCPQAFAYSSPNTKTYELRMCLPRAAKGFQRGWNVINPK